MYEKYHDVSELAKLSDDELDAMADKAELSCCDIVEAKLKRHLDAEAAKPIPVSDSTASNDGFDDPYIVAITKQLFPG